MGVGVRLRARVRAGARVGVRVEVRVWARGWGGRGAPRDGAGEIQGRSRRDLGEIWARSREEARLETERVARAQPHRLDLGLGEQGVPQRDHVVRSPRARRHAWHARSTGVRRASSGRGEVGEVRWARLVGWYASP